MEAPANRASCLMCAPFFPMMAPTAWVGMKRFTISCSGYWKGKTRQRPSQGVAPAGTYPPPTMGHQEDGPSGARILWGPRALRV